MPNERQQRWVERTFARAARTIATDPVGDVRCAVEATSANVGFFVDADSSAAILPSDFQRGFDRVPLGGQRRVDPLKHL
jgi:hypothetical protein